MGFTPLSDADAASKVVRSSWEPRPQNQSANQNAVNHSPTGYDTMLNNQHVFARVTGNFSGTTDEIIQWAAIKWGLSVNLVRAVAYHESFWIQSAVGDNGDSFGLTQVRNSAHSNTFPWARDSTAFNLDYYCALIRGTFNGWETYLGSGYTAGDIRGCLGRWFTGWWHTPEGDAYADAVLADAAATPWRNPGF